jgi:hypothetical protein
MIKKANWSTKDTKVTNEDKAEMFLGFFVFFVFFVEN